MCVAVISQASVYGSSPCMIADPFQDRLACVRRMQQEHDQCADYTHLFARSHCGARIDFAVHPVTRNHDIERRAGLDCLWFSDIECSRYAERSVSGFAFLARKA